MALLGLFAFAVWGLCWTKSYETPQVPLPAAFRAQGLDGGTVDAAALRGKPWVVNLWMVG